jgi:ATP-dependent helicase/nuclease subunit B
MVMEEFSSRSEEAFAVALSIRKAIFNRQSVLVVSPDQSLTKKIKSELLRWNIVIDDSISCQFSKSSNGLFIELLIEALKKQYETTAIINLFKCVRDYSDRAQELEEFFRRQNAVSSNFFLAFEQWDKKKENSALCEIVENIKTIKFTVDAEKTFSEWFHGCYQIAECINFESAEKFFSIAKGILRYSELLPTMNFEEFCAFLKNQVLSLPIKDSKKHMDNVVILGILEAQLFDADLVIIAAANEENWFVSKAYDFWLDELILKKLNINLNAKHEFVQCVIESLLHKKNVLITRSKIVDGVRMQKCKYIEKLAENVNLKKNGEFGGLISSIKKSHKRVMIKFEKPNPALNLRPKKLWVSDIDLLINNPYVFYAKRILRLSETKHINEPKNIRGNYLHNVLEAFVKNAKNKNDIEELNYFGQEVLRNSLLKPNDFGLWFFKINKIFSFIVKNLNPKYRYITEITGSFFLEVSDNCRVQICCRADRIDVNQNDFLSIIDYKTGLVPTKSQVNSGLKIQLPVEGIIAQKDGFNLGKTRVEQLCFWYLNGIDKRCIAISNNEEETNALCKNIYEKLIDIIKKYNVLGDAYEVNTSSSYDESYMHLARVKEWCQ